MTRRAWTRPMILWLLVGTMGFPGVAQGQEARDWETNASWHNKDYFAHTGDRELASLLDNVEKNHLGKGFWEYYRRGQYGWAMEDLKYILRVFPNHPKALELMGSIARLMKKPALPLPWFQKAITMFPQHAMTRAQFGGHLLEIGEIEVGLVELVKAIEMAPELAYAHARLARAYQRKGDTEAARVAAERARTLGFKGRVLE